MTLLACGEQATVVPGRCRLHQQSPEAEAARPGLWVRLPAGQRAEHSAHAHIVTPLRTQVLRPHGPVHFLGIIPPLWNFLIRYLKNISNI